MPPWILCAGDDGKENMQENLRIAVQRSVLDDRFPSPIRSYLDNLRHRMLVNTAGEVATYIPELAKADPEALGICITMADGTTYARPGRSSRCRLARAPSQNF